jgi:hypothetical protein
MSDPARQFDSESMEEAPVQGFADFQSALESLHSNGLEESFENLVLYFSVPGREAEIGSLFSALDFHRQIRFIELLMSEVFEGESHHHEPSMIVYRKRISEGLRVTKGEIGLDNSIAEARVGRSDSAISFFRAHPRRIKEFLAELGSQFPDEANAVTLGLVEHLLKKLQESSGQG